MMLANPIFSTVSNHLAINPDFNSIFHECANFGCVSQISLINIDPRWTIQLLQISNPISFI